MHRVEGDSHRATNMAPVLSLSNTAVGDVAQGAVTSSQASTEPVGHLATERAIGVVHTHESQNLGSLDLGLGLDVLIVPSPPRERRVGLEKAGSSGGCG